MTARATISRDELRQKIDRGDAFLLFEVLPEPYYRKHHLPGARHMPPTEVVPAVERATADKDAEIVLYCWDDH
ncbi:MAG: rhodanese-like domain-containing protein [Gemmatimonadaceae bacterium]